MAASGSSSHHGVIIVGAGWNGIIAAKTYLQINPSVDILIVDGNSCPGGVWSSNRIYPGLIHEMPCPMLNLTDFDMPKEMGIGLWEDVDGYQVNEFLTRYAQKHDIPKRCRFNTQVVEIQRAGSGWKVLTRSTGDGKSDQEALTCDKLIVATGITSKPKVHDYDLSKFDGTSFHSVELGKRHHELLADEVKNVTVIGGHKSALESVGSAAQAGKKVEWLVREEGGGPCWLMPSRHPDGSSIGQMTTKRFMAFLSTSVYRPNHWLVKFLHSGKWRLGSWISSKFWGFMTKITLHDWYTQSENGKKLRPKPENMFWFTPGATIIHDRDVETIRLVNEENLIRVSREHMVSAAGRSITLSNGDKVPTDLIVFCIGWELTFPALFSPPLGNELGLPVDRSVLSPKETLYWQRLDAAAEAEIDGNYPILKNPPSDIFIRTFDQTDFRLFRAVVPPKLAARGDNSFIFLGSYASTRLQQTAELNSLWGVAYLEGLLPPATKALLADEEEMNKDIAHIEAYRRKRYLNTFLYRLSTFETSEYDDLTMKDLGLRADRKRMRIPSGWRGWFGWKAWIAEWFDSYLASDYEGIIEEFMESVENRRAKGLV